MTSILNIKLMKSSWYKRASLSDIRLYKSSDINWKDVGKGLGWGAALGTIPAIGLSIKSPEIKEKPTQLSPITQPQQNNLQQNTEQVIPPQQKTVPSVEEVFQYTSPFEGVRNYEYKDSRGIPTIGIGFNLTRNDAKQKIESLGLNYEKVLNRQQPLNEEQIKILFQEDAQMSILAAQKWLPNFSEHPKEVQLLIIDLAFNLGSGTLSKFVKAKNAFMKKDYKEAASELQNSKWFGQVGNRAIHHVNVLKNLN
jgi:lysozyme